VHSNFQTYRFAIIITLACSILLAGAASILKPRQKENIALDIKKNILKSAGITSPDSDLSRKEIQKLYADNIRESVINDQGVYQDGKKPVDLDPKKDKNLLPIYQWVNGEAVNAYIIPISGKGLWSTIYGYIAIEPDGETVKGITFYQHGETPGLGGEIDKDWLPNCMSVKKLSIRKASWFQ
jgi:Na+-transporting NADH:ubiquinone oxidoreductase subunit C